MGTLGANIPKTMFCYIFNGVMLLFFGFASLGASVCGCSACSPYCMSSQPLCIAMLRQKKNACKNSANKLASQPHKGCREKLLWHVYLYRERHREKGEQRVPSMSFMVPIQHRFYPRSLISIRLHLINTASRQPPRYIRQTPPNVSWRRMFRMGSQKMINFNFWTFCAWIW